VRRFTPIELAIAISLIGCIAAVAIPTFARELHASRFAEPTSGLARLGASAVAYAQVAGGRFPDSAPLTPAAVPRGTKEVDPVGTWDGPTWSVLAFRASPEGVPHAYSFAFDGNGTSFVGRARGDLDGDGVLSTFEVTGSVKPNEGASVDPGMHVEAELE
jgi:hypothetical protein